MALCTDGSRVASEYIDILMVGEWLFTITMVETRCPAALSDKSLPPPTGMKKRYVVLV
jgi:hypothetical protein